MAQGTGNVHIHSDFKDGTLYFYESTSAAPHETYNVFRLAATGVSIGGTGNDVDFTIYTGSSASYITIDSANGRLQLADDVFLTFGTGTTTAGDVQLEWDTTGTDALRLTPTANNTLFEIGSDALHFDLLVHGSDTTNQLDFDASADLLYTTGIDMQFRDSDKVILGTGAGAAGDAQLLHDGTSLILNTQADDLLFEIGDAAATQLSMDVRIYGDAANGADYFQFDAGDSALKQAGAAEYEFGRMIYATITAKTSNYTVTAAETGTIFTTIGASGTMTFTLPTVAAGLFFKFICATDNEMAIASASADQIICFNDVDADAVSFDQAGNRIGASIEFLGLSASKWHAAPRGANTMTVTT